MTVVREVPKKLRHGLKPFVRANEMMIVLKVF